MEGILDSDCLCPIVRFSLSVKTHSGRGRVTCWRCCSFWHVTAVLCGIGWRHYQICVGFYTCSLYLLRFVFMIATLYGSLRETGSYQVWSFVEVLWGPIICTDFHFLLFCLHVKYSMTVHHCTSVYIHHCYATVLFQRRWVFDFLIWTTTYWRICSDSRPSTDQPFSCSAELLTVDLKNRKERLCVAKRKGEDRWKL